MTFNFVMDAFPDYTKFNRTEKVFCEIQVITEAVESTEDKRTACVLQEVTSLTDGVNVTFDNDGTEDYCKLTVSGNQINGTLYDENYWGTAMNNAAEIEIIMPIEGNGDYRLVSQNPALQYYESDPDVKKINGVWTKDKVYTIDDGSLTTRVALSDVKGSVLIKLFAIDDSTKEETLVKTFSIKNDVNFAKSYKVEIKNNSVTASIENTTLNEETVSKINKVISGDKICLTLNETATVTASGGTVTNDGLIYTIEVGKPSSGTVSIEIN